MAWIKKFKWGVEAPDLTKYIGRSCSVKDDNGERRTVEIEEIYGSLAKPTKLQVNAKGEMYLISMLDFFAQMNGEKVSEVDIALFDETAFHVQATRANNMFKRKKLWTPR